MPLWTRSRQLSNADDTATEEAPTPDGPPKHTPNDTAGDRAGDRAGDDPDRAVGAGGWLGRHLAAGRAVAWVATALAVVLVFLALLLPNHLGDLKLSAFTRVPVEGIFGVAVLLVVPRRVRRVVAVLAGLGLGLLTILKLLDMGFYAAYARPFDLVLDWILFDDGVAFLRDSVGQVGAIGAVIGAVVLALALPVLMTLAVLRLSNLMARHTAAATSTTLVLGTVWVTCAALSLQIVGEPVAARTNAVMVDDRAHRVSAGLKDGRVFAKESAVDAFEDTPPDELLTGLRGKNVVVAFIESYGRSALADPEMAPQVGEVLADGTDRLSEAGFSSRSGFLTSPTTGGGSWLAHSTFMSGLWVDNEQRYRTLTASDRLTLTGAFQRSNAWRTVGVMPGVIRDWPEGQFYDFDKIYDSTQLGYKGPKFSWSPVPDQFSMAAFERLEHSKADRRPLMSTIILASSHNPWAPIPTMIGWDEVGDGSVYHQIKKEGKDPKEVWKDPAQARTEYRRAIEYSLNSLVSYMENYGDDDTVFLVLGDHEPIPAITADDSSRDVPISVIARDKAVMDRISDWNWHDGLKPGPKAPVWRMDTFRDRFLTTYGPTPGSTPPQPNR